MGITTALEQTAARRETDVSGQTLEAAADLLTLRRDAIQFIDGEPGEESKPGETGKPGDEEHPGASGEEKQSAAASEEKKLGNANEQGDAGQASA